MTTSPPSVSRISRQYGVLKISQPHRPPRPIAGIALLVIVCTLWNLHHNEQTCNVDHMIAPTAQDTLTLAALPETEKNKHVRTQP
jgi:hypothetical protein